MILQTRDVSLSLGGLRVLNTVSIEIPDGGMVGIVGTNGAGKSSLFAVVSGQLRPSLGTVIFDGEDITRLPPPKRARMGLARTFQVPREFKNLTVLQNMLAAAPRRYGETFRSIYFDWSAVKREEEQLIATAAEWLEFLNLGAVASELAGSLSGGQKKLLELGRVLMLSPRCILLDEPYAGVNPVLIGEIGAKIKELNQSKKIAFAIIEHHLEAVSSLVDHLYAMNEGKVIAAGRPGEVMQDPQVLNAYMGGVI